VAVLDGKLHLIDVKVKDASLIVRGRRSLPAVGPLAELGDGGRTCAP